MAISSSRLPAVLLAILLFRPAVAAITLPPPAPPLPAPSGAVVAVSSVGQLEGAVAALASNTTILIAPGTYNLTQTLRIRGGVSNVSLRGSTGNRDDVVLLGSGMGTLGAVNIAVTGEDATDILIANLSIGQVRYHPIQLKGESGCDRVRLYNLRLFDAGEQFVKGTVDFGNPDGVDDGVVEYCVIEYTTVGPEDGYTNGVDIHYGNRWIIRYNLFRNIRVPATAPESLGPAVLMWSGSRNTICDANTFLECERSIAFGLGPQAGFAHGHEGGVIRNNFVYRAGALHADAGISVWDSPNTEVLHNTVIQNGTYPNAIEYRFAGSSGLTIRNNLTDGAIAARDGASASLSGNLTSATPAFFVAASAGDLHLVAAASAAIDHGVDAADCPLDWDGQLRPIGVERDIGADEYAPPIGPSGSLSFYSLPPCRLLDTRDPAGPYGAPALPAGGQRMFTAAGRCGVPSGARALSVNVTVTQAGAAGDLRLFRGDVAAPLVSVINYRAGQTRANNAVLSLDGAGAFAVRCDQASGSAELVLDVNGYFQ